MRSDQLMRFSHKLWRIEFEIQTIFRKEIFCLAKGIILICEYQKNHLSISNAHISVSMLRKFEGIEFGDVYEHIILKQNFLLSVIGCQNFKCRLLYVKRCFQSR